MCWRVHLLCVETIYVQYSHLFDYCAFPRFSSAWKVKERQKSVLLFSTKNSFQHPININIRCSQKQTGPPANRTGNVGLAGPNQSLHVLLLHNNAHRSVVSQVRPAPRSCKTAGDRSVSRHSGVTSPSFCIMCSYFTVSESEIL